MTRGIILYAPHFILFHFDVNWNLPTLLFNRDNASKIELTLPTFSIANQKKIIIIIVSYLHKHREVI